MQEQVGDAAFYADVAKISIQFIFITIGGGGLAALVQYFRDKRDRKGAILESLRELIDQVDQMYRASKQVKRVIRPRLRPEGALWRVEQSFFSEHMAELSKIQLTFEQYVQTIYTRTDMFSAARRERIVEELAYAEQYLRSVHDEFEKRRPELEDGSYILGETCVMLRDFLVSKSAPEKVKSALDTMERASPAKERHSIWQRVRIVQRRLDRRAGRATRRCKYLANTSLRLVLKEMREELMERSQARLFSRRGL